MQFARVSEFEKMSSTFAGRRQRTLGGLATLFAIIGLLVVLSHNSIADHVSRGTERIKKIEDYFRRKHDTQEQPIHDEFTTASGSSVPSVPDPLTSPSPAASPSPSPAPEALASLEERTLEAASNATLGFSKILAIHMKHRWDKWDASVLQSYVSGVDLTYFEAVDGKVDIKEAGYIGLPPMSQGELPAGPIACYRSHANIWADLVRTRGPPVMIFESDAAWDVNLRGIMGVANGHFLEYLKEIGSKPIDSPPYLRERTSSGRPARIAEVQYDPDDPWQSEHWDVLALGHCQGGQSKWDNATHSNRSYTDQFLGTGSGPEAARLVSRSIGWLCTTSYAVSHRGAAKMLLNHAIDLSAPLDLIMSSMINAGEMISYAINPGPIVQWDYHDNLGLSAGASSDLHRIDHEATDPAAKDKSGFDEVRKLKSPWVQANKFGGTAFRFQRPALMEAWKAIASEEAQFKMPDLAAVNMDALKPGSNSTADTVA